MPSPAPGWRRVWTDSFDGGAGSRVDADRWTYDVGPGSNFGTGEIETATDSTDNVFQDGRGNLVIRALGSDRTWTSGRIRTPRLFGAPAGGAMRVSASIQQPNPAHGLGYWPAFWMLGPGDWPGAGEIDILEDVNARSHVASTFHCGVYPDGPCNEPIGIGSGLKPCPGCQTSFHTYSVVVDRRNPLRERIRWYLDGAQTFAIDQSQVPAETWRAAVDHGFAVILDLAVGGGFPDGVCGCSTPTPQTSSGGTLQVGYVAVDELSSPRGARQ
ncbi:family 16 glycosylhydrolase [Actinopolymorpha rutila]|uniref:Beta-glucanase (GH16 family) n=1 Tax=Actinopolymorpha rutila TaxID=446787 RepID=A0A852ZG43_9ACTN|nr:beta-glucanase (GH16 family) [Actinopolymorpha rutila]